MTAPPVVVQRPAEEDLRWNSPAELNRWLLDCLDAVAGLSRSHGDLTREPDPAMICAAVTPALRQFASFRVLGFWTVDDQSHEFEAAYLEAPGKEHRLLEELDAQVDKGTFGWALKQNRPLIVPAWGQSKRSADINA